MGNLRLHEIERFHTSGTSESERLKVTALNLFHPTASPPFQKVAFSYYDTVSKEGWCEKIETIGRSAISSKFYNCGCLEGKGNKAPEIMKTVKVFQREALAGKGTAVKLFRYPCPPSRFEAIFSPFHRVQGGILKGEHRRNR